MFYLQLFIVNINIANRGCIYKIYTHLYNLSFKTKLTSYLRILTRGSFVLKGKGILALLLIAAKLPALDSTV